MKTWITSFYFYSFTVGYFYLCPALNINIYTLVLGDISTVDSFSPATIAFPFILALDQLSPYLKSSDALAM